MKAKTKQLIGGIMLSVVLIAIIIPMLFLLHAAAGLLGSIIIIIGVILFMLYVKVACSLIETEDDHENS